MVASPKGRPTSCIPIGSPDPLNPQGTESAGTEAVVDETLHPAQASVWLR